MSKELRDCEANEHVRVEGVVIGRNGAGQIVIWFPGLGKSGTWTMPGNIEVETVAGAPTEMTELQRQAIARQRQIAAEADFGE